MSGEGIVPLLCGNIETSCRNGNRICGRSPDKKFLFYGHVYQLPFGVHHNSFYSGGSCMSSVYPVTGIFIYEGNCRSLKGEKIYMLNFIYAVEMKVKRSRKLHSAVYIAGSYLINAVYPALYNNIFMGS